MIASNNDDHTKNHSFLRTEDGRWSLSPAYDITFAYNPNNRWLRQHLMSVNGKFEGIKSADLMVLADQFEVPDAREIVDQTISAVSLWPRFAAEAGVSIERTGVVSERLNEVQEELELPRIFKV